MDRETILKDENFLFHPFKKPSWKRLQEYPEFKLDTKKNSHSFGKLNYSKIVAYIILCNDPRSPVLKEYPDELKRKIIAMEVAGYKRINNKFRQDVENVLLDGNDAVNKMVKRYNAILDIEKRKKELYDKADDNELELKVEDISRLLKKGETIDSWCPYTDYKQSKLKFIDDSLDISIRKDKSYDSFIVNNGINGVSKDPDLIPIRISLPKAPKHNEIDGYDKPKKNQKFQYIKIPDKLQSLEKRIVNELDKKSDSNMHFVVTNAKIQQEYWDRLSANKDYYKEEIEFIKKMWWHRLNGYWFFNNGIATYISGWHFFYLNFWKNEDYLDTNGMPEYRDRDRREFLFYTYCYTTTETFKDLDRNGNALKDKNGKYNMIDLKNRVCFGFAQNKNRRSGLTNKCLNIVQEVTSRTIGTDGGGIMSYTNDNAKSHYGTKLVPAWRTMPLFFKPITTSTNNPTSIRFEVPGNIFSVKGLDTQITHATTADPKYYDGKKLIAALLDEEGKTSNTDIYARHNCIKQCLSQGNGAKIHGFTMHPSTVEEYSSGGEIFRDLCQASNFYKRMENGQTETGMFLIFISSVEGLDEYVDEYGFSVIHDKNDDKKYKGAYSHLNSQLEYYKNKGDTKSLIQYRSLRKQFPFWYRDSWLGESGEVGWDMNMIDERISELERLNGSNVVVGNFEWENGIIDSKVCFVPREDGKFEVSKLLKDRSNQRSSFSDYDALSGQYITMYRPLNPDSGVVGSDAFRFKARSEIKSNSKIDRMSDGGISAYQNRDPKDITDNIEDWEGNNFICVYRHRAETDDEFAEDVLKCCVWYGFMSYPENNIETVWKHFIKRGYKGYLKYDINEEGRISEKPGVFYGGSTNKRKQEAFSEMRNFISLKGNKINHLPLLKELRDITCIDELTRYDLLAASLAALLGSKSPYSKIIKDAYEKISVDVSQFGFNL